MGNNASDLNSADRFSNLPQSLICEILSWLPIREAIATCILSRSWRNRWKDLQILNFSTEGHSQEEVTRFMAFVNWFRLQQHRASIPKLRIHYYACYGLDFDDASVKELVSSAIGSHLEELKLDLWSYSSKRKFMIPSGLFNCCTALVNLELVYCMDVDDLDYTEAKELANDCFPCLKTLKMSYCHRNLVMKILSGSPVLETLDLERMRGKISVYKIHAPSLKRLYIFDSPQDEIIELLEIHTPLLEYLHIRVTSTPYKSVSLCNLPNLVEAYVDCFASEEYDGYVPQLVSSLSQVKSSLVLISSTSRCLIRALPLDLPDFRYLVNLELVHGRFNPMFIFGMLESCPMLQVLTIHQIGVVRHAWTKPTSVPYCLASQLSIVNFSPYYGKDHDKEFIAYVLQEGLTLKSISIGFAGFFGLNSERRQSNIDKLSHLPKGSKTCQLYFKSDSDIIVSKYRKKSWKGAGDWFESESTRDFRI